MASATWGRTGGGGWRAPSGADLAFVRSDPGSRRWASPSLPGPHGARKPLETDCWDLSHSGVRSGGNRGCGGRLLPGGGGGGTAVIPGLHPQGGPLPAQQPLREITVSAENASEFVGDVHLGFTPARLIPSINGSFPGSVKNYEQKQSCRQYLKSFTQRDDVSGGPRL